MTRLTLSPRWTMRLVAGVALALGTVKFLLVAFYEERDRLRSLLDQVDGITDIQILGHDVMPYEVHAAQFAIIGRPDAVVVLDEPSHNLVHGSGHIEIRNLGPWDFHTATYGRLGVVKTKTREPVKSLGYSSSVDVGTAGEFADRLPVKIRDVQDLVDHYDDLVRFFGTWPDDRDWAVIPGSSDPLRVYCRTPRGARPVASPTQFPETW